MFVENRSLLRMSLQCYTDWSLWRSLVGLTHCSEAGLASLTISGLVLEVATVSCTPRS